MASTVFSYVVLDKTQVFHDQIQDKQKELQPWTAQINAKQAEIDVATSERDALVEKAETLRTQTKDAEEMYSSLQLEYKSKVLFIFATNGSSSYLLTD